MTRNRGLRREPFYEEDGDRHPYGPGQPGEEHIGQGVPGHRDLIVEPAGGPDQTLEHLLKAEQKGQGEQGGITPVRP